MLKRKTVDRDLRKMRKELRGLVQQQKRLEIELAEERKKAPLSAVPDRKSTR